MMVGEVIEGGVASVYVQLIAEGGAFDFDDRFVAPFGGEEKPATEYLFGREALIGGVAVEFCGEVFGKGLQRADATFVKDIDLPHTVGRGFWQGGRGGRGVADDHEQEE